MNPFGKRTIILVFTTLFSVLIMAGCENTEQPQVNTAVMEPVRVTLATASLVPVTDQVELIGTVEAVNRAEIAAKVSGTITTMPVVLGSRVKKGDLLLEISAGEIDAKLQQSYAQLEQAKRNLARERKLLQKNAATPETVKSLEESLAIAEAAYQEARIMQSYTRVLSPFAGRVTSKDANVGDLATPGKALVRIEDETRLQVLTNIPETIISKIQKGDQLRVKVPAANLTVPGTVAEVAPTANPTTRSGKVKLDLEANPALHPGQFARVALALDDMSMLAVPASAVSTLGQMQRVFVVQDDVARLRLVRCGASHGDQVEILSGLTPGEQVVVTYQQALRDLQPVTFE